MNGKYILLHGGILLAVGIYAAEFITWNLLGSGIVLALLLSMIFISYIWKRKSIVYIGSALFICFAGFIRMEIAENLWQNQSLYLAGHKGDFYGVIAEEPTETAGENEYSRYLINLDKIIYPDGEEKEISGKVYVYDPSKHGKYEIGDKIIAKGELRPVHIYKNPGKINLEKRYKSLSVIGRIYGEREGDISFISHSNEYYLLQKSVSVREEIKSIFAPYVEAEHLPVLMTLLFGGHYSEIPESVITSFSTTGIIHILSVSGSHIVLLFGFLYIVGKYLGLPRKITAGLSIIFVLVYGGIAGFVPPVVRSSVMGILTVLAVFTERDREPLNLLGAAVSGMLLFNPYYLYDISFQLSVLASAGILLFYRPLSGLFSSVPKIPSWIKDGAALSLSAQILLVPVILYYFHVFPLYFIPANLLVTPLLECVIIAGLSAIILSFLIKPLAIGVLYGADYLLGFGLMLNNLIASLPNASIRLGGMTILQMISYYALISIFYFKGKWKSFTKGIFAVKICTGILILLCVLESFLKPETSVFVPELGSDLSLIHI